MLDAIASHHDGSGTHQIVSIIQAGCVSLMEMTKRCNKLHGDVWFETSIEDTEDELVRIAAWEGCAHAVILALKKAHEAKEVRLLGCNFLKVWSKSDLLSLLQQRRVRPQI